MSKENAENKTFELSVLNPKNLANLKEWEAKQIKLVEDNPFVKITDPKSFKEAKSRRTNLRTGRTDLEKQDKAIGTKTAEFRKGTKEETGRLIQISQPKEDEQQAEIDRYQAILDEEKVREAKIEEERIEGIKNKITDFETTLDNTIAGMEYGSIKEDQNFFEEMIIGVENEFDFMEYDFKFQDMIDSKKLLMKATCENIVVAEEKRLVDEKVQGFAETLELDDYVLNPVVGCYEKRGFEIYLERLRTFSHTEVQQRINEVNDKIVIMDRQDHDKIVQEQKDRVIQVREGLLDMVHQIDVENYEEQEKEIQEVFKNNLKKPESFVHAKGEFDKMVEMVQKALNRKSEEIDAEKKRINEQLDRDLDVFLKECQRRYDVVVELGFEVKEFDDLKTFEGFGMSFTTMEIDAIRPIDFNFFIQETKRKGIMFQEDLKEQERLILVKEERIKTIKGHGMIENKEDGFFEGFGCHIFEDKIMEFKSNDEIIEFINRNKKEDQAEKDRQEYLKEDKESIIDYLKNGMNFSVSAYSEKEEFGFILIEFESEFEALRNKMINKINNL